jgi:ubiquinone/menaquinone biosynthesis C-methylase UbiE
MLSRNLASYVPRDPELRRNDPVVVASSFLNYGYQDLESSAARLELAERQEPRRHSIQLYHHMVEGMDLTGLDVLEVGSGRGGGCLYFAESLHAKSVTGVDLSPNSIAFSRLASALPNVSFRTGDAEALPFPDESFDVVVNVESSHCYGSMRQFVAEVARVLRPGGIFSWADARFREDVADVDAVFAASGLKLVRSADITRNVLRALDDSHDAKVKTIHEEVPALLQPLVRSALAVRGTLVFNAFQEGALVYLSRRFQKPEATRKQQSRQS